MATLDHKDSKDSAGAVGLTHNQSHSSTESKSGSSIQTDDIKKSLESTFNQSSQPSSDSKSQPKSSSTSSNPLAEATHVEPDKVSGARGLSVDQVKKEDKASLEKKLGQNGDFLDSKGGNDTVIGGSGNDVIRNAGGGFKTVTGGGGSDTFTLGKETTARIFGFDPGKDQFAISDGLKVDDIRFGQGTDPTKGGLNQPLNSENNTVVFDASGSEKEKHILASLSFVQANTISENNFVTVDSKDLDALGQKA